MVDRISDCPSVWGLVRAVDRSRPRNNDEAVEDNTERGDTKDNRRDGRVDSPKVEGECAAEQEEGTL